MSDLAAGLRYLGQGQKWVANNGRWFGFGLLPALITLVLYVGALFALVFWSNELAAWATPFADDWDETWRSLLRISFVVALVGLGLLLAVVTFTAVTLLIGDPFYESLSERVEETEGGGPTPPDRPLWRQLWNSLTDSLYVLVRVLAFAIPLFLLSFVPFVGQTVVPVLGVLVSGFFLTVELTSVAMQRRGIPVQQRLQLLRQHKALAIGFGAPLVLSFLIPLATILLMPGAVAGATLLVRGLLSAEERGKPAVGYPAPGQSAVGYPAPGQPASGQSTPGYRAPGYPVPGWSGSGGYPAAGPGQPPGGPGFPGPGHGPGQPGPR